MISVLTLALAPTFFVMLLGYTAGRAGIVNNMHVNNFQSAQWNDYAIERP